MKLNVKFIDFDIITKFFMIADLNVLTNLKNWIFLIIFFHYHIRFSALLVNSNYRNIYIDNVIRTQNLNF